MEINLPPLPEYYSILEKAQGGGPLTHIERFICDNEPAGSEDVLWRAQLQEALQEAFHRGRATVEADRQQRGEAVGEMIMSAIVDGLIVPQVKADLPVGTKLYATPQPVEPVKVPSDAEAAEFADEHGVYYDMDQAIAGSHARAAACPHCGAGAYYHCAHPFREPSGNAGELQASVDKAWSRFQAAMSPTDEELEEFAAGFADELGRIHGDTFDRFFVLATFSFGLTRSLPRLPNRQDFGTLD